MQTDYDQIGALVSVRFLFSKNIVRFVFLGFMAMSFSGCVIKRSGYDVPEMPLPAQYRNSLPEDPGTPPPAAAKSPAMAAAQDAGMVDWWRAFGNAELSGLIDRGIANNPDVRIATLKIAQAKERADQARADQRPAVTANVGESIQAPGGQIGSVPVTESDNKTSQKLYQASLLGNWRIDLWGEKSALAESAGLQVWQAAFDRDGVQATMIANLASTYVEYLSVNDRLRIAQEADVVLSGVLETISRRVDAGDATIIELEQQRATIFAVRATIPTLEQQREDAIASIAFLVGTVPGALSLSDDGLDALLLPKVVPALPSSLILRRPDVRTMEAKLLAADADIDVARARLLPPLDLSAQMGYSSLAMGSLFQPTNLFWNVISNLTVSIFDSGKLESQKKQAQAAHEEMVESYARTIYQSVREVESALAAIRLTAKRYTAQEDATLAAQRAWDGSNEAYAVGGLDYITLLDTARTYLRYLDDYQRIKMDRYRGYITLFQALGGADFGQAIPGKGVRPTPSLRQLSRPAVAFQEKKPAALEGVEWAAGQTIESGGVWRIESFWQVELPGLYHRASIGPTWRDLRTRFPALMEGRIVRPRLSGRIEDSADGLVSWYRLYVAKFSTPAAADALCAALKSSYQRCRVVSSNSDDTVVVAAAPTPDKPAPPLQSALDETKSDVSPPMAMAPDLPPARNLELQANVQQLPSAKSKTPPVSAELEKESVAYTVQLGAFSNLENAAIARTVWRYRKHDAFVAEFKDGDGRTWYAVRTGVFAQRREASLAASSLRRKEGAAAVAVPMMLDKDGKPSVVVASALKLPSSSVPQVVPEPPEAAEKTQLASSSPLADGDFAYSVQLGAFSSLENASVFVSFWHAKGYELFVTEIKDTEGRIWYAVRTGVYLKRNEASASALHLGRVEGAPAVVVRTVVDKSGTPTAIDMIGLLSVRDGEQSAVSSGASADNSAPVRSDAPLTNLPAQRPSFKGKRAYAVQFGAFSTLEKAAKSRAEWQEKGYVAYVTEVQDAEQRLRYAVRAGAFVQRRQAAELLRKIVRRDDVQAILVPAILDPSGRLAMIDLAALAPAIGGGH